MKRQFRVSRCENDAVAGEYESNVVVRRVLVLIQVGLAALARDKHTPNPQLDFCNAQQCADGCEVAAEPLGEPSHFSVGAEVEFTDQYTTIFLDNPAARITAHMPETSLPMIMAGM